MPNQILLSEKEAVNLLLPGGKWGVFNRFDISGGAESYAVIPQGYRHVKIYSDADCYLRFDVTAGSTVSTANDVILPAQQVHDLTIPYDIGQQASDKSVVIHLRQVGTASNKYARVICT